MPKMAAALGAVKFGADHAVAGVPCGRHGARLGLVKAGPARTAFIFGAGIEQFGATAGAHEPAAAFFGIERAGTRPLRAVLFQNVVLFRGEFTGLHGISFRKAIRWKQLSGYGASLRAIFSM